MIWAEAATQVRARQNSTLAKVSASCLIEFRIFISRFLRPSGRFGCSRYRCSEFNLQVVGGGTRKLKLEL